MFSWMLYEFGWFHQHFYVASKDGNMSYWVVHQQEF